jgi:DNA-binding NtrC family response regulator
MQPNCFVTIITSDSDTRRAVEAMKSGAFDYLFSPLDFTEVERVCLLMSRQQQRQLQDQLVAATGMPNLIGNSAVMATLKGLISTAAAPSHLHTGTQSTPTY